MLNQQDSKLQHNCSILSAVHYE